MPSTIDEMAADIARSHLAQVRQSGKTDSLIAREAGVSHRTVREVRLGIRQKVGSDTKARLLSVAPAQGKPRRFGTTVPSIEGVRILRGLFAQGWSWRHLGDQLGGVSKIGAYFLAHHTTEWMQRATLIRIRAVAAELGPYDVRDLATPLPGMTIRAARAAERNEWATLKRWSGRDIADPDASPEPPPAEQAIGTFLAGSELDEMETYAYIDPVLVSRTRRTAEMMLATTGDRGRPAFAYIEPLGRLTKLEMHAVWWIGENAGLNDTQIGQLLGYPARTEKERVTAQRQMNRIRLRVLAARDWAESHPRGWIPVWFNWKHLSAKRNLPGMLPALMAIQPPPFGFGWTVAQLAENCGLREHEIRTFLDHVSRMANDMWEPRVQARSARRRGRATSCARPAPARAA